MKDNEWILPYYPEDHQIYYTQFEVEGEPYRRDSLKALMKLKDQYLRLEAEPSNSHDRNAIKVIGVGKGWFREKSLHIGYIPAVMAAEIAKKKGAIELLFPRLRMIDQRFDRVVMELTGPQGRKKAFFS
jgi:hypothetical protein